MCLIETSFTICQIAMNWIYLSFVKLCKLSSVRLKAGKTPDDDDDIDWRQILLIPTR